jgi:hypothetical protein
MGQGSSQWGAASQAIAGIGRTQQGRINLLGIDSR